jgi:hypothetical protein
VIHEVDHIICVTYLYAKYKDEGHHGVALREKLWAAAVVYAEVDFLREMEETKGISKDAYDYLAKIDLSTLSKTWFKTSPKCDLLVNNLCECFNAYILKSRDQLIITMLEMIRKKLMRRYQTKRDGIRTVTGRICPRIERNWGASIATTFMSRMSCSK